MNITKGTKVNFHIDADQPASGTAVAAEAPSAKGWFTAHDSNGGEWFLNVAHVVDAEETSEAEQGQWVVRDTDNGTNLADRTYATREDAEKFAASFNRYNEHERYGVALVPTAEEVAQCVEDMKVEILRDIADGTQPADVNDFSTLHDYVDANTYAGLCDDDNPRACWDVDTLIWVQEEVHQWLQAGRPLDPATLATLTNVLSSKEEGAEVKVRQWTYTKTWAGAWENVSGRTYSSKELARHICSVN